MPVSRQTIEDDAQDMFLSAPTTTAPADEPNLRPLRLAVTQAEYDQLRDLANEKGTSLSQFLLDAVSIQLWIDDTLKDGGQIIAKPKHGKATVLTAKP